MQRDMDLIRKILLALEADAQGWGDPNLSIEGYTDEQVGYNCWLIVDAGLAIGEDINADQRFGWWAQRLTWAGHEFLDAARDTPRWNKAKSIILDKAGGVSFELLKQLLLQLARQAVFGG